MSNNDSDMDYYSDENDNEDYYNPEGLDDLNDEQGQGHSKKSPEDFVYTCLSLEEVEKLLNESVEQLSNELQLIPYLAKILLHEHKWNVRDIVSKYHSNATNLLVAARIKPSTSYVDPVSKYHVCSVCYASLDASRFQGLTCGHSFCRDCWATYFECQIGQGVSTAIGCMASNCDVRAPEDMVLNLITRPILREKYQQFAFRDFVKSHPELRFCPGPNCQMIARSVELSPKKVVCTGCRFSFCFVCGNDYHAPTDCQTIQRWLTKCADDSETANYISANTKDCPKCYTCIEKNGGCNHMQCSECKYDFCWMCMTEWKEHGSEYYECSRYKDNPRIAAESLQTQAREALKKYLHYFERWDNHSKSLQLEQRTRDRIDERLHKGVGTWVEWQFLIDASAQLAKCRYTLQYTYPYAYFMESGSRKTLFEYQQGKLEAEIENLSWKIERAETTDHGDVKNQMYIAEKWRMTLLKEFFPSGGNSSSGHNTAGSSGSASNRPAAAS